MNLPLLALLLITTIIPVILIIRFSIIINRYRKREAQREKEIEALWRKLDIKK